MADLKIPNLNKSSGKYLFKKKLTMRRKSKRKLLSESFLMIIFGFVLFYLNYLIPNKYLLFANIIDTFAELFVVSIDLLFYLYQIFLVIFMIISIICLIILFIGSFYRIFKVLKGKSERFLYK